MSSKARGKSGARRTGSELGTAQVAISELNPYPGNPRRGDISSIRKSLEVNGQYRPIVVNRPTMEVLAGNHTLAAAKELGWAEIAVTFIDADPEHARRIVLADNRTNDLADYDSGALAELLSELEDFEGTGYAEEDLDELLDELDRDRDGTREDTPPPLPRKPKTKSGDLYILGRHRLLCADARERASYERLLEDKRIDLLWTDPPYGIDYEGKTAESLRIKGDCADGLVELLKDSFEALDTVLKRGARLYVCHPSGERAMPFLEAFLAQGWRLHQELVWVKDSFVLGHCDYHFQHESILYGSKPGRGRTGRGGSGWYGDDAQASVLEVPRSKVSRAHPTMKPAELIEIALRNSSRRSHLILDPFAGSGSTLIAAERSGRSARVLELDPRYCDVIVERFEADTGLKAKRERS